MAVEKSSHHLLTAAASTTAATERKGRLSDNQKAIRERREQVFRLLLKNLMEREIAETLGVSQGTVSYAVQYLQNESVNVLNSVIEKQLPFLYEKVIGVVEETGKEAYYLSKNQ